jgi:CBS domain-containing protein
LIPVCLASATAAAIRLTLVGPKPAFAMPEILMVPGSSISFYILLGALIGVVSVYITKVVYWVEDAFEHLPIHWMWWPAVGGIAVGVVGYFAPHTLGVGYDNIENILAGELTGQVMLIFCLMKFISWAISLGSGTSGGTLAPLFTIGGGIGAGVGLLFDWLLPHQGIDPRVAALVGMAAVFAGASRALLASLVFAFETTRQPLGLLPLLGGCTASYLISCLMMKNTIMTEKIVRRGVRVPAEYVADHLDQTLVIDYCSKNPVVLQADAKVAEVWDLARKEPKLYSHQGFPVLDGKKRILGVVTRRDLVRGNDVPDATVGSLVRRGAVTIAEDRTLREAADLMARERIGRLPVVATGGHGSQDELVGMLTRSDILSAHDRRLRETYQKERSIRLRRS